MTDLLPCPFCGGEAVVVDIEPHSHGGGIADFMPDHPGSSYIECGCGVGIIDSGRAEVIERWNKRASLSPPHTGPQGESVKLSDPHPHWSVKNKNENYPKTVEEWNPHKDPAGQHLAFSEKRLRVAMDRDDPRAPDEMALVSRWDLTTLVHDWWHKCAVFDMWRKERKEAEAKAGQDKPTSPDPLSSAQRISTEEMREARIVARLAWNNWPDNESSRNEIAAHEARDAVSAAAWDRVIAAVLAQPAEEPHA